MKNNKPPQAAHHAITTARRPDNIPLICTGAKWQGLQNWTDEKLATKLTKDDQQQVLLIPARWWPDTLPELDLKAKGDAKGHTREQSASVGFVAVVS